MNASSPFRARTALLVSIAVGGAVSGLAGCVTPAPLPPRPTPARTVATQASASPAPIAPASAARQQAPRDEIAFYDLTEAFGLQVSIDLVTGRRVCRDAYNEVVVMPSSGELVINRQRFPLDGTIRWRNGVLCLPGEARSILAQHLRLTPVPDVGHDPDEFDGREMALNSWSPPSAPAAAARESASQGPLPAAWRSPARRPWQFIVIHHSATAAGDAASFHREHAKKWENGLGYHFVIGNGNGSDEGAVEVGTRWLRQGEGIDGAHAGNKRYNQYGIGICLVGDFNRDRPSPAQLVALRRLCRALMARYGIPRSRIVTHTDVRKGHTDCPGTNFPLEAFIRSL